MKRWMNSILGMVMAVMCMMMAVPVTAAENPGVSIPVTVSLSGTQPELPEDFNIKWKADDDSYPMPEGAEGDVYTMLITGAGTKSFPMITYDRVGIYTYTIYQEAGNNKKCTYDDTVYTLTVYITNAEDGSGLEATAVLYPDTEGDKMTGAGFKNEYETENPNVPDIEKKEDGKSTTTESLKTGDEATPILYAVLFAVSLGVIAILFLNRKVRRTEE